MFAPGPLREGGWFVMPAQLADGREVDLWRSGAPLNWERPAVISRMYKSDRWRKYMVMIADVHSSDKRSPFAQWLAARWNERHPPNERVMSLQIYLMMERTLPEGRRSDAKQVLLLAYTSEDAAD